MRKHLRVILGVSVAVACGRQSAGPVLAAEYSLQQAADSVPLPFRKDVRVGDIWMTLNDVPSDSRCPRGVACMWAGDGVGAISVHPPCYKAGCEAPSVLLSLHTTLEPRAGSGWGHRIELRALLPEPVAGKPTDAMNYVAWVRVTKQGG